VDLMITGSIYLLTTTKTFLTSTYRHFSMLTFLLNMKIHTPLITLFLIASLVGCYDQSPPVSRPTQPQNDLVGVKEECTFPPKRLVGVAMLNQVSTIYENPGTIVEVAQNDTLTEILSRKSVMPNERYELSKAVSEFHDLRRLRPGNKMEIWLSDEVNDNGRRCVERFRLMTERDSLIELTHIDHDMFPGQRLELQHKTETKINSGEINTSFFLSARKSGVPREVLTEFYNMFSSRVDFQRDIRKGDRYSIVYEENDDSPLGGIHAGRLLYASLTLPEKTIGYYRYTTLDGYSGFFNENGESVDTHLLKTPLSSGHLSSVFGARTHPVLGYKRMHRGIDFSAAIGTPILAAGDGVVERVGRYGSYGKYVRIRHGSEYTTGYAHLSAYAKGVKPGVRVTQGTVIGYVGKTGLTTGPNLHYEVSREGRRINPMTLELPPVKTLQGKDLRRFKNLLRGYESTMAPLSV